MLKIPSFQALLGLIIQIAASQVLIGEPVREMVKFLTRNGLYKGVKESYHKEKPNKKIKFTEQQTGFAHLNKLAAKRYSQKGASFMCKPRAFTPLEIKISNRASPIRDQRPYEASKRFLTGFTLVELLVVIAIIALLMSILLPAMSRVRKQAKAVMGQSNLRQLANCFEMYTSNYDGYFQEGYGGAGAGAAGSSWWLDVLKPYYQDVDVCLCPMASKLSCDVMNSEIGATFIAWSANGWLGPRASVYGSFGINGWVEDKQTEPGVDPDWTAPLRWRHTNVRGAAYVPLLLDSRWIDGWPRHNHIPPPAPDWDIYDLSSMGRFCIDRHFGHINGVFLDYSVRKIGLKELWKLEWHRGWQENAPSPTEWDAPDHWMYGMRDYD